jgi:serine/threonine protein kinase
MLTIDERKSGEGSGRMSFGMRLGPYEIAGFIGAGAMGEVYRAHDTSLNRVVALKMLPIEFASDPELLHRFEEEARTASALSHPAVVTIYEAGQIGSQPYISMELVAGETLREILAFGAMPLRRALGIAGQIAEGLTKAHEAGLVHRDLKPENIKVSVDGFAKILDFGLAKRVSPHVHEPDSVTKLSFVTSPGTVLGTAGYMAPEQASGGPADARSDQFAFGAVVYEMLTGQRAFDRPTIAETLSAIIREEPAPIAQLNPAVPAPVRWIVERCLAKDPAERYALTRDLARDLASAREHLHELLASRPAGDCRRTGRRPDPARHHRCRWPPDQGNRAAGGRRRRRESMGEQLYPIDAQRVDDAGGGCIRDRARRRACARRKEAPRCHRRANTRAHAAPRPHTPRSNPADTKGTARGRLIENRSGTVPNVRHPISTIALRPVERLVCGGHHGT